MCVAGALIEAVAGWMDCSGLSVQDVLVIFCTRRCIEQTAVYTDMGRSAGLGHADIAGHYINR